MSVESDTMHYYADLDRQQARDAAFESAQEDAMCDLYDELTKRCGEPLAEALTSTLPYSADDLFSLLDDARKHVNALIDQRANDKIGRV